MRMLILLLVVILLGILSGAVGTRPKRRDDERDADDRDLFWYDHFDSHG